MHAGPARSSKWEDLNWPQSLYHMHACMQARKKLKGRRESLGTRLLAYLTYALHLKIPVGMP